MKPIAINWTERLATPKKEDSDQYPPLNFTGEEWILRIEKTGSRVISPEHAKMNESDWDWVALVAPGKFTKVLKEGLETGWDIEGDEDLLETGEVDFVSLRSDNKNLIIVKDSVFFENFVLATNVAKELKLSSREKRVCLFQAILYKTFKPLDTCRGRYRD